jgi:hypothetical protein
MELVFQVATIVGMWKMFEKAGEPGWPALIPFYNVYKLCEITMGNPWYWLRLFVFCIPIIGWVAGFYFLFQMYKATAISYGKPDTWAWGLLFLSPIFYCIIGFGDAEYYGPMGIGDNRTGSAREAKTVNFDVIKNEPARDGNQEYRKEVTVEPVEEKKEETVDFYFDQPEE